MKQGFIVPVYRHASTVGSLTKKLLAYKLPIIIVDDGNNEEDKATLSQIALATPGAVLVNLVKNSGKGGAVMAGIKKAAEIGLTHALQIDADGQHDDGRIAFFLEESAKQPERVICGYPEYDDSVPKSRLKGRKISNFWAAVTTVSGELVDVLCGFRVYPVVKAAKIIKNPLIDKRMGFDPEIMVRLYWKKVFPVFHPVKVHYPEGGVSNFNVVKDNIRISLTFARLCLGMLLRFPYLLVLNIRRKKRK